jgi:predicted DNA-binding transcriptional regulator AlpA
VSTTTPIDERLKSIPQMVRLTDVAKRLDVKHKTLVKWAKDHDHQFPVAYKYGRCWFVNEAEVSEWLKTRESSFQDRAQAYRSRIAVEEMYAP